MSATMHDLTLRLRPHFDENAGPVVWCRQCWRERVQWTPDMKVPLCAECEPQPEAGPEPRPAA